MISPGFSASSSTFVGAYACATRTRATPVGCDGDALAGTAAGAGVGDITGVAAKKSSMDGAGATVLAGAAGAGDGAGDGTLAEAARVEAKGAKPAPVAGGVAEPVAEPAPLPARPAVLLPATRRDAQR